MGPQWVSTSPTLYLVQSILYSTFLPRYGVITLPYFPNDCHPPVPYQFVTINRTPKWSHRVVLVPFLVLAVSHRTLTPHWRAMSRRVAIFYVVSTLLAFSLQRFFFFSSNDRDSPTDCRSLASSELSLADCLCLNMAHSHYQSKLVRPASHPGRSIQSGQIPVPTQVCSSC